ncbi:MAG: hypothetical protein A3I61_08415 [Acidobacteria bacterium RIFCSPLOWO2_02_FULL_68_18]|nr:MAG: hypothetical protein A3I61_08415 [Acidobacteria bacterium RIFCSPLOWO2_02_FULL_68_18]OFW48873.1 MAG: hypothetical protein A3G77_01535 [Acidobacteria bacterium RIFCSPLOWO2_12_FULL_68_19]
MTAAPPDRPAPGDGRLRRLAALTAASLAFAAVFCWPLFGSLGEVGVQRDWDQHLAFHWVPFATVTQYAQIPLWNPFLCGGMPMLGNPQSRWLTPFFVLHLWGGPELGLELEIIAHIALAWLGAFLLGRTCGLSRLAALAPATAFAGSSYHYLHLAEGHLTWLPFAYMPWILAAASSNRPLLAGAGLALAIGEGGVYPATYTGLALGVLALYGSLAGRSARPLAHLGATGAMAACLAAPKLLLVLPLLARNPRLTAAREHTSLDVLVQALVGRGTSVPPGYDYGFHEYGAYVGPIFLLLAMYGASAWTLKRRTAPWLILFGLGLVLSFGGALGGESSPWALLHRLPLFASLRAPSRFLVLSVLAVGMLAGFGVDRLAREDRGRRRAAAVALLLTAAADLALMGPPHLQNVFATSGTSLQRSESFVQLDDEDNRRTYAIARANMGALNCYEPLQPTVAPIGINEPGYRGEQYLLAGGRVSRVEWSPHRLTYETSSDGPNTLVINANFDRSWQVVAGRGRTFDYGGLLAVEIPPGPQRLSVAYRSTRFTLGVMLALGALVFASLATRSRWRSVRARLAASTRSVFV